MVAAALGGLGVMAGAFGAHALRGQLSPERLDVYMTAVHYQQAHALALLGVAVALEVITDGGARTWLGRTALMLTLGVLIFSGSLYCLVFSEVRLWGAVTPFGGVSLILGWFCLFLAASSRAAQGAAAK